MQHQRSVQTAPSFFQSLPMGDASIRRFEADDRIRYRGKGCEQVTSFRFVVDPSVMSEAGSIWDNSWFLNSVVNMKGPLKRPPPRRADESRSQDRASKRAKVWGVEEFNNRVIIPREGPVSSRLFRSHNPPASIPLLPSRRCNICSQTASENGLSVSEFFSDFAINLDARRERADQMCMVGEGNCSWEHPCGGYRISVTGEQFYCRFIRNVCRVCVCMGVSDLSIALNPRLPEGISNDIERNRMRRKAMGGFPQCSDGDDDCLDNEQNEVMNFGVDRLRSNEIQVMNLQHLMESVYRFHAANSSLRWGDIVFDYCSITRGHVFIDLLPRIAYIPHHFSNPFMGVGDALSFHQHIEQSPVCELCMSPIDATGIVNHVESLGAMGTVVADWRESKENEGVRDVETIDPDSVARTSYQDLKNQLIVLIHEGQEAHRRKRKWEQSRTASEEEGASSSSPPSQPRAVRGVNICTLCSHIGRNVTDRRSAHVGGDAVEVWDSIGAYWTAILGLTRPEMEWKRLGNHYQSSKLSPNDVRFVQILVRRSSLPDSSIPEVLRRIESAPNHEVFSSISGESIGPLHIGCSVEKCPMKLQIVVSDDNTEFSFVSRFEFLALRDLCPVGFNHLPRETVWERMNMFRRAVETRKAHVAAYRKCISVSEMNFKQQWKFQMFSQDCIRSRTFAMECLKVKEEEISPGADLDEIYRKYFRGVIQCAMFPARTAVTSPIDQGRAIHYDIPYVTPPEISGWFGGTITSFHSRKVRVARVIASVIARNDRYSWFERILGVGGRTEELHLSSPLK